jgi:transcriptional regulator with XRE-family HTH domain
MNATALVDALKRILRAEGITYAALAVRIGMSEASVKRMFSKQSFSLQRLDQILGVLGIDFQQLAQAGRDAPQLITQLSHAQEKELIGDVRLLIVAVNVMNLRPAAEIVAQFNISEAELVTLLLRLDKIGFLELLPNNRVKLLIARTFTWIPNGPIQSYFRDEAFIDFLDARFDGEDEQLQLVNVMLSKASIAALQERLRQVATEFSQQHKDDARLPPEQRHAVSFLLAERPWLPKPFQRMLRPTQQ